MRTLIIVLLSLPSMALAQMLVDQVDGDTALLCSDDIGEWVCIRAVFNAIFCRAYSNFC